MEGAWGGPGRWVGGGGAGGVGGGGGVSRQHQDPRVVIADGQLRRRADHPLGHPAVGLARGDLEAAGQHRAGHGQRHQVAHREVAGAADHVLLAGAGVHPAVPNWLLELGELLDLGHLADDHAGDLLPDRLDGLHFQARRGQPARDLGGLGGGIDGRVLEQPRERDPHYASIPNARLNRTSPSTVSLMSVTPCRIISVRSIPRPNANPLYRSGSMPHATSTRGLTMPAPAISIQPWDRQTRHGSAPGLVEAPRHTWHSMDTSADGSVNGKKSGRSLVRSPSPNIASTNAVIAPRKSAMVRPSSTASSSIWWNTGLCVASRVSVRQHLPGLTTYSGS